MCPENSRKVLVKKTARKQIGMKLPIETTPYGHPLSDKTNAHYHQKKFSNTATTERRPLYCSSISKTSPSHSTKSCSGRVRHYDFHDCPPAIQRKYFSSLERLRIAHATGNTLCRQTATNTRHPLSSPVPNPTRRQTRQTQSLRSRDHHLTEFKSVSPNNIRLHQPSVCVPSSINRFTPKSKNLSCSVGHQHTPADLLWFRALPVKAQHSHFIKGKRIDFSRVQSPPFGLIPDATDCRLYQLSQRVDHVYKTSDSSIPSLVDTDSSDRSQSDHEDSDLDEFTDVMDESMMQTLNCLDESAGLDLASTLDDYHRFYAPASIRQRRSRRTSSFRKVMSMTSIPTASDMQTDMQPVTSPTSFSQTLSPRASSTSPTFFDSSVEARSRASVAHVAPFSITDDSATYYQDPSARLKLRVYLASPQKFDEAIEFGFPSLQQPRKAPRRPHVTIPIPKPKSKSISPLSQSSKTFLDDTNEDIFDAMYSTSDEESTGGSRPSSNTSSENDRPKTPGIDTYLLSPTIASPSSGRDSFSSSPDFHALALAGGPVTTIPAPRHNQAPFPSKPIIRYDPTEPLAQILAGNREMTLRMTLTRPDLRAYDSDGGPHTNTSRDAWLENDPLSIDDSAHVTHAKPLNSIWSTLPAPSDGGRVRKLWRKVSGRTGS